MRAVTRVLVLGVLAVLPLGTRGAAAADCPNECRSDVNEVVCKKVVTTIGDIERHETYYWSRG